jgi:hypothetical protein
MKFACPSVVLREGETNSGATEIFHPWASAVAQAWTGIELPEHPAERMLA